MKRIFIFISLILFAVAASATVPLKQSTATTVTLGPMVDSTDGNTTESALTISQSDVRLSKNGGAYAQKNDSNAATHDEDGWYRVALDATDTGTVGYITVAIHEAGALPVWRTFEVLPANVFNSRYGTDYLDVSTVQVEGSDATDQILASVVDDATRIDASALNTLSGHDPGEAIMGATDLNTAIGDVPTVAEFEARTIVAANYFDPAADTVNLSVTTEAQIDAIEADTNELQGDDYPTLIAALPTDADVQAAAAAALTAYDPPTNAELEARTLVAASYFDPTADTVARVTLVDTVTTNTDMRGTDGAYTGTPPTVAQIRTEIDSNSTQLAAIVADTNELQTDWANGGRLDLLIDAIKAKTDLGLLNTTWTDAKAGYIDAAISSISASGGDATAANQTTIINHLVAAKGDGFTSATDSLVAIRDRGDAAWASTVTGTGDTEVDHDTTANDGNDLYYKDSGGTGIGGAVVYAYLKTDFDAGTYTLRAQTVTEDDGSWAAPLMLNSGSTYTIYFFKTGAYGPDTQEVTVE